MTGLEVVNKVVTFLESQIKKNSAIYVDLGNPSYLELLKEDQELLEYMHKLMPWRDNL